MRSAADTLINACVNNSEEDDWEKPRLVALRMLQKLVTFFRSNAPCGRCRFRAKFEATCRYLSITALRVFELRMCFHLVLAALLCVWIARRPSVAAPGSPVLHGDEKSPEFKKNDWPTFWFPAARNTVGHSALSFSYLSTWLVIVHCTSTCRLLTDLFYWNTLLFYWKAFWLWCFF